MRHNFTYKLIDKISEPILSSLKQYVVQGLYTGSNDFQEYTLTIRNLYNIDPPVQNLFEQHLAKFFKLTGHIGTNVARMVPGGYVPEHSDYMANTFGSRQDSIVKMQIPIITNPGAGLCWKWDETNQAQSLFLEEGGIYVFDNCKIHSSVNLGASDRYWITTRWDINSVIDSSII
jgi:hypothetical protein